MGKASVQWAVLRRKAADVEKGTQAGFYFSARSLKQARSQMPANPAPPPFPTSTHMIQICYSPGSTILENRAIVSQGWPYCILLLFTTETSHLVINVPWVPQMTGTQYFHSYNVHSFLVDIFHLVLSHVCLMLTIGEG